ncbi:MAG: putative bifunctional diguanylate cyclase/phosphodiesterase [Lachnotalea sp.]
MRLKFFIKNNFAKFSMQFVLLILIVIAMLQFIAVSFTNYFFLKDINIEKQILHSFIQKLFLVNISMVILFVLIVYLVNRIFTKINNYAFYSCTTGLPNKNYVLNNLIGEISKSNDFAALISLDMDNFKAVNDTLGHLAGDELLRQAGIRLKQVIKLQDCVCHIGGDEFLFFVRTVNNKSQIEKIANEMIDVFSKPFVIDGKNVNYVTASIGIALIPENGVDFQTLYNCADDAMYSAKSLGKNNYKFYNKDMTLHLYEDSVKRKEVKDGIENKEFKVYYQPKISSDGTLLGAEALVRWMKKDGRILPPSEFIDFAETNGFIIPISDLVIDEVCNKIIVWTQKGYKDFVISINITAEHLNNEKICKNMIERIKSFQVLPQYIEFEITESMIIKDFDIALSNIKILKDFGVKISLDDFGTGYSSLNYLKKLPIDIVKIDKSFIDTMQKDEKDRIILENIINISHSFHYEVVAEGVEEKEQFEVLKEMKCDVFQGYYFGKPMEGNTFENDFLKLTKPK